MYNNAILCTIFNMASSYLNKVIITTIKTNPLVAYALNKTCLIEQFYRHCSGTAIFLTLFYL